MIISDELYCHGSSDTSRYLGQYCSWGYSLTSLPNILLYSIKCLNSFVQKIVVQFGQLVILYLLLPFDTISQLNTWSILNRSLEVFIYHWCFLFSQTNHGTCMYGQRGNRGTIDRVVDNLLQLFPSQLPPIPGHMSKCPWMRHWPPKILVPHGGILYQLLLLLLIKSELWHVCHPQKLCWIRILKLNRHNFTPGKQIDDSSAFNCLTGYKTT